MGYILFTSKNNFSIHTNYSSWNGTIEYSYDNIEWHKWRGEKIINNKIYMRGIKNTVVSNGWTWTIYGTNVKCQGNIENLLDYKSVVNNVHPKMDCDCFAYMFESCTSLIEAPQLLTFYISMYCYINMFAQCTSLIKAPMFPNLTIAKEAIINQRMLEGCSIQQININNKLYDINVLKLL